MYKRQQYDVATKTECVGKRALIMGKLYRRKANLVAISIGNNVNTQLLLSLIHIYFSTDKGVEFGRLYRRGTEWKFQAVGEAHKDGLEPICRKYCLLYTSRCV